MFAGAELKVENFALGNSAIVSAMQSKVRIQIMCLDHICKKAVRAQGFVCDSYAAPKSATPNCDQLWRF